MTAATVKQDEAVPATYPATPSGLSTGAAAVPPAVIWQRIEAYVSTRWTAREVVWLAEGPGDWALPLAPGAVTAFEEWTGTAWVAFSPDLSAFGYALAGEGPYRFTATIGSGTVPAAVDEAYRRLAEYFAGSFSDPIQPGQTSYEDIVGPLTERGTRPATWLANAVINSGAADLLRPYRRLA
jgi:hypothetical protein